jgi:hypothetical protein
LLLPLSPPLFVHQPATTSANNTDRSIEEEINFFCPPLFIVLIYEIDAQ